MIKCGLECPLLCVTGHRGSVRSIKVFSASALFVFRGLFTDSLGSALPFMCCNNVQRDTLAPFRHSTRFYAQQQFLCISPLKTSNQLSAKLHASCFIQSRVGTPTHYIPQAQFASISSTIYAARLLVRIHYSQTACVPTWCGHTRAEE